MANGDLIRRAAAIECMKSMADGCYTRNNYAGIRCRACMWDDAMDIVDELPAIDAVPVVHARWIDYKDEHQCSACKETTIVDFYVWKYVQFDYCPNCGAKMDGNPDE